MEILIRSIFIFSYNKDINKQKKDYLLNVFTWMIINSYKNYTENKNGHFKIAYYYRELMKYLFQDGDENINSYDDKSKNHKKTIKDIYKKITYKTIEQELSNIQIKLLEVVNNNINLEYLTTKKGKEEILTFPFFINIGKDYDKKIEKHFYCMTIAAIKNIDTITHKLDFFNIIFVGILTK